MLIFLKFLSEPCSDSDHGSEPLLHFEGHNSATRKTTAALEFCQVGRQAPSAATGQGRTSARGAQAAASDQLVEYNRDS